jgi:carboxyl-terminal processing protease
MENGLVKVVSPIDETPAAEAGLEPGDLITHLDGEQVLGMTLAQAVEKMRGAIGSDIVLTIRRADQKPFDVAITRAVIKIRSVRSRLEGKVG